VEESWCVCVRVHVSLSVHVFCMFYWFFKVCWGLLFFLKYIYFGVILFSLILFYFVLFYFGESKEVHLKESKALVGACHWRRCYLISEQHKRSMKCQQEFIDMQVKNIYI